MFPNRMFASALLFFALSETAVFAEESHDSPWQGEWVSTDNATKSGLSLRNCSPDSGCVAEFYGLDSNSVSCLREGKAPAAAEGGGLVAIMNPSSPRETSGCRIRIIQNGSGDTAIIAAKRVDNGEDCNLGSCMPLALEEERKYRRVSKETFSRKISLWGKCFGMDSPAGRAWCTDSEVQEIIAKADLVPYADVGWAWGYDERMLQQCDSEADPKTCLRRGFTEKFAALEKESNERAAIYTVPGDPKEAKKLLGRIHGVYKRRFENSNSAGETYQSENILEIVQIADDAAYVKLNLEFYNGHVCNAVGIVEYKSLGGFVFQDPANGNKCLLTLKVDSGEVVLEDPAGICRSSMCGARGYFDGTKFPIAKRRSIRYMPRIEKSEEYKKAVSEFQRQRGK